MHVKAKPSKTALLGPTAPDVLPSQRHTGFLKSLNTHANTACTTHPPSSAEVPQWNSLTYIKDAVPRPTPPPALELLMLCVLQAAVMENHTNYTLLKKDSSMSNGTQNPLSRWLWFSRVEAKADLLCFSLPLMRRVEGSTQETHHHGYQIPKGPLRENHTSLFTGLILQE